MGKQARYEEEQGTYSNWVESSQIALTVYHHRYNSTYLAAALDIDFPWFRHQQAQPRRTSDLGLCVLNTLPVLSMCCALEEVAKETSGLGAFFPKSAQ